MKEQWEDISEECREKKNHVPLHSGCCLVFGENRLLVTWQQNITLDGYLYERRVLLRKLLDTKGPSFRTAGGLHEQNSPAKKAGRAFSAGQDAISQLLVLTPNFVDKETLACFFWPEGQHTSGPAPLLCGVNQLTRYKLLTTNTVPAEIYQHL